MSSHSNFYSQSSSSQDYPAHAEQSQVSGDRQYTIDELFRGFQGANTQYWTELGLAMPANYSAAGVTAPQATVPPPPPYFLLQQEDYVTHQRRFQPLPPIVFHTTVGYVRLEDAKNGNLNYLHGIDDPVFSGDNLSQKQSLRLQIVGLQPFERQINVRNPANNARSITRGRLAEKVAKEIFDFMKRQKGPLGTTSGLGPGTNGFERLVLIELRHVSRSSWQPVLGVLQG